MGSWRAWCSPPRRRSRWRREGWRGAYGGRPPPRGPGAQAGRKIGPRAAYEPPARYDPAVVALLDIVLGYDCNLACTYCTITDEMRQRLMPTARVAREIERAAGRGFRDVAFTGGEP